MKPLTILRGDVRKTLRDVPDESIDCGVTSPPYYGQRNYGHKDQIGLESTPAEFVEQLVLVFREFRRCLKKDGTLWVNLGDSYAGSGRGLGDTKTSNLGNPHSRATHGARMGSVHGEEGHTCYTPPPKGSCLPAGLHEVARQAGAVGRAWVKPPGGFKSKDLLGIPWRVAFALQADGWFLRQDIIWSKPNPMPESVTDRCTKAHEYIFLFSKSARYHFDAAAIAEPAIYSTERTTTYHPPGQGHHRGFKPRESKKRGEFNGKTNDLPGREAFRAITETRNKRSVWTVPSKPYKGAHFATFPPDLIKPCILAGCKRGGVVLDPFGGSGTTGRVALELGRKAVLCELNPDYVALIEERTTTTMGLGI